MDTVNRVVESASKAIWGEQNGQSSQATASNSQGMTGIESVDKVVDAGKKAIWGDTADQSSIPHGEEPVAGKRGLGTATDPYDAGNRDEQPGAPSVEAGGLTATATEQRNFGTIPSAISTNGGSSLTAAGVSDPKTTSPGLRPDPSTTSSLKHTVSPLEDETQNMAKDLQNVNASETTAPALAPAPAASTATPAVAGGAVSSNQNATKHAKDDSLSSSFTQSSVESSSGKQTGQKSKITKLEKVKNKLHIGNHSPKASR